MNTRLIQLADVPCWFELSWQEKPPTLLLKIHDMLLQDISRLTAKTSHIQSIRKEFPYFTSFDGLGGNSFGFNNALQAQGKKDDFHVFRALLPRVCVETKNLCTRCNGKGKGEYPGETCWDCFGGGRQRAYEWDQAYALSASLTMLFTFLRYPTNEQDTPVSFPQLLAIETMTREDMHGGSLGGTYSKILCDWLRGLGERTQIPEMIQAMKAAYFHMLGRHPYFERQFNAYLLNKDGWLNVECPGDACGLNPNHNADWNMEKGEGYEFSCHNVDTPVQQFTLLAGLAALHDRARKEIGSLS